MYMQLEDEFGDVVGKARRGQEKSVQEVATAAGPYGFLPASAACTASSRLRAGCRVTLARTDSACRISFPRTGLLPGPCLTRRPCSKSWPATTAETQSQFARRRQTSWLRSVAAENRVPSGSRPCLQGWQPGRCSSVEMRGRRSYRTAHCGARNWCVDRRDVSHLFARSSRRVLGGGLGASDRRRARCRSFHWSSRVRIWRSG